MLFTSPMFAFVFLPISLFLYYLFGKRCKRAFVFGISVAFHLLLHAYHPVGVLFLLGTVLYCWLFGKALTRYRRGLFVFAVCVTPYLFLILFRNLLLPWESGFWYPVGMTVVAMRCTSYLLEAVRGEIKRRNRLFDLAFYLLFFPTMLVGPFVKYSDFLRLCEEDRMELSPRNLSDGVRLFASGFVKRIALGATLIEAVEMTLKQFLASPNLMMGVCLLAFVYFGVYFSVTGYADMGCGISYMLGIRLRNIPTTPFRSALPDEYSRNLFPSLHSFLDDYVVRPMTRMLGGRFPHLIHAVAYGGCLLLIVRPSLYILLLAIPSMGLEYACSRFDLEHRLEGRIGPRVLYSTLTVTAVAVGWVFITMGDVSTVWEYMTHITYENPEYYTDLLLVALSGRRFLVLIAMGILLLLPSMGMERYLRRKWPRIYEGYEAVYTIVVLILFLISILFFLPKYGIYNNFPFRFVYV